MKVVVLAGGLGTRLAEETEIRPKPMVEIGGKPILWHIMKHYAHHGFREFIVALGYKGEMIKRYFHDLCTLSGDMTICLDKNEVSIAPRESQDWIIHLVDTGSITETGGRIKRLRSWLQKDTFMVTYGDGVSDVDLRKLLTFHKFTGCAATVTAVRPPARFGGIIFNGDLVKQFTEKPQVGEGWINGGYMVLKPDIFDFLKDDDSSLEKDGLEELALRSELAAFRHEGFWQCMDTLRDKRLLERLWQEDEAPWKVWE